MKVEKLKKDGHDKNNYVLFIGLALITISMILFLLFFLKGQTKVSGAFPADVLSEALQCTSDKSIYPYFETGEELGIKNTVNAIFSNNRMSSISLISYYSYNDKDKANASYNTSHAKLNTAFNSAGFEADAFNASFANLGTDVKMSLYATYGDLSPKAGTFFMLQDYDMREISIDTLSKAYEQNGFTCKTVEE